MQVAVLPQASVAVYVLVNVLPQPFDVVTSLDEKVGTLQLSVAVGFPGAGIEGLQPNVPPAGQEVTTGA